MDEKTPQPEQTQEPEREDLELAEEQAQAVTGGAKDSGHAGEIDVLSRPQK